MSTHTIRLIIEKKQRRILGYDWRHLNKSLEARLKCLKNARGLIIILALSMLFKVVGGRKYMGQDRSAYDKYGRVIVPGMHQQLAAYNNSALMYGMPWFDIPCDRYKWIIFDTTTRRVPPEPQIQIKRDKPVDCYVVGQGVYLFMGLPGCTVNTIYAMPGVARPPYPEYDTPLYARTRCSAPYDTVKSRVIVSDGPGWFSVRFAVENDFMYTPTFRMIYRKVGDINWVMPKFNSYFSTKKIMPRVKPQFACPPWNEYSVYCILVTDHIRVMDVPYEMYEGQIQTKGLISPGKYDYLEKGESFFFRVHNCDVTLEDGCPVLDSESPNFKWPVVSATMSPKETTSLGEKIEKEDGITEGNTEGNKASMKDEDNSLQIVMMIFLFLFVAIPFFIAVFLCAKRRARNRALRNWYYISSPDWPVAYTLRLPPGMRPASGRERPMPSTEPCVMDVISQRPAFQPATLRPTRVSGQAQPEEPAGVHGAPR